MNPLRLHVVGFPHAQTDGKFTMCAYTEKTRKFTSAMTALGHTVILYSGDRNTAVCSEHVACFTEAERVARLGEGKHYTQASFDPKDWVGFNLAVAAEVHKRAQRGDFLCVVGGVAQKMLSELVSDVVSTVEYGVGYGGTFARFRVYESYAWMHACYGAESRGNPHNIDGAWYHDVIPGGIEMEHFPLGRGKPAAGRKPYALYMGRMIQRKGIHTAALACKAAGIELITAGPGDPVPGVKHKGEVGHKLRAKLMGEAQCVLVPTQYAEPFGTVVVEAGACGTPVVTTDWGAFTETVLPGVTGYRCRSLPQFVDAINGAKTLGRKEIREYITRTYSMPVIAQRFDDYFRRISKPWSGLEVQVMPTPPAHILQKMKELRGVT